MGVAYKGVGGCEGGGGGGWEVVGVGGREVLGVGGQAEGGPTLPLGHRQ